MKMNNIIRVSEDELFHVKRILHPHTSNERAEEIKNNLNVDTLLRNSATGEWICCNKIIDAQIIDVPSITQIINE